VLRKASSPDAAVRGALRLPVGPRLRRRLRRRVRRRLPHGRCPAAPAGPPGRGVESVTGVGSSSTIVAECSFFSSNFFCFCLFVCFYDFFLACTPKILKQTVHAPSSKAQGAPPPAAGPQPAVLSCQSQDSPFPWTRGRGPPVEAVAWARPRAPGAVAALAVFRLKRERGGVAVFYADFAPF